MFGLGFGFAPMSSPCHPVWRVQLGRVAPLAAAPIPLTFPVAAPPGCSCPRWRLLSGATRSSPSCWMSSTTAPSPSSLRRRCRQGNQQTSGQADAAPGRGALFAVQP